MNQPFDASGLYYDLLYAEKDTAAEVAYVEGLLRRHGVSGRELLEFGSGTGRHAGLLARRGWRVHGLERSAAMVQAAQQVSAQVTGFSCQQGDITTTRLQRRFDAVLALFHVVSYQIRNAEVQAVFANAAEHLEPGGLFVFDVWYSPAVLSQGPEVRVKRLRAPELAITRIAEPRLVPNENRVDVHYSVFVQNLHTHEQATAARVSERPLSERPVSELPAGEMAAGGDDSAVGGTLHSFEEIHPMRHFSLPELDLLAEAAGFERLVAEEWLSGAEPSAHTWGVALVLRRR